MRRPTDLQETPDPDVVALALQGRQDAYTELVQRYEKPVFSLLFRVVRDRELAEDLAQDTFVKVLNNLHRYDPAFKLSSWLFRIANNVAIDHLRKKELPTLSVSGAPDAVGEDAVEATSLQLAAEGESPLDEVVSRELGSEIERAIAALRPEYRTCIILRHVEDRSYEEIAAIMDLPLGTVKTYIHRARNELKELLKDHRP